MTVRLVEFEDPTHRANVIVTKTTTWDLFVQKVKERLGYLTIDAITNEDGDAVESLEDLEHRGTCFVQGQSYAKLKRLHNAYQNRTVTEGGKVETTSTELAALMDNVELAIDAAVVEAKLAEEEEEGIHLRAGQFRARFFSSSLGIGLEPGEGNIGAIVSEPPEPGMDGSGADSEDLEEGEKNPVCVEDTLIYVEDASVAGLSFEDVVVVIKSASPPRSLIFERARTITLVLEERYGLHFRLDPMDNTRKVVGKLPRENAARYAHVVNDLYYVFALNGEDVTNCTPAEIASKVDREPAPWSIICVRSDLPMKVGFDAIAAEQFQEQASRRFLHAARTGDLDALGGAIDAGQDTAVSAGAAGWGAVHLSAANGHNLILGRMLKERGKSCLAMTDVSGQTALHVAASRGQIGAVSLLLRSGSPRVDDVEGRNALHLACQYGHLAVVRSLLDAGYDPTRPDGTWQWPALHWAAKGGVIEVVKTILDRDGVDLRLDCAAVGTVVSALPRRAVEIAQDSGHAAVAKYLRDLMDSEPTHKIFIDPRTGGTLWIGNDEAYAPAPLELRSISCVLCVVGPRESAFRVKKPSCVKRKYTARVLNPPHCEWNDLRAMLAPCLKHIKTELKAGRHIMVHSRECGAAAQCIAAAYLVLQGGRTAAEAVKSVTTLHGEGNAALSVEEEGGANEYLIGLAEIEGAMEDRELERQSKKLQAFFKSQVTTSDCP